MTEIQLFTYEGKHVRTTTINGETWWVAKDVCDILEYSNSRKAVLNHCFEDDVTNRYPIKDNLGREQYPNLINESGLLLTKHKRYTLTVIYLYMSNF